MWLAGSSLLKRKLAKWSCCYGQARIIPVFLSTLWLYNLSVRLYVRKTSLCCLSSSHCDLRLRVMATVGTRCPLGVLSPMSSSKPAQVARTLNEGSDESAFSNVNIRMDCDVAESTTIAKRTSNNWRCSLVDWRQLTWSTHKMSLSQRCWHWKR